MNTVEMVVLAVIMAVTVEGLVEYVKTFITSLEGKDYKGFVIQMIALLASMLFCWAASIDVYAVLGASFGNMPYLGMLLTAVPISRGANYFSDWVGKLRGAKA